MDQGVFWAKNGYCDEGSVPKILLNEVPSGWFAVGWDCFGGLWVGSGECVCRMDPDSGAMSAPMESRTADPMAADAPLCRAVYEWGVRSGKSGRLSAEKVLVTKIPCCPECLGDAAPWNFVEADLAAGLGLQAARRKALRLRGLSCWNSDRAVALVMR